MKTMLNNDDETFVEMNPSDKVEAMICSSNIIALGFIERWSRKCCIVAVPSREGDNG